MNSIWTKDKILVLGPESSGTRMVSKFMAASLGIIPSVDNWNGIDFCEGNMYSVYHRSLPHGKRDNFPTPDTIGTPEEVYVVLCTRDLNIAMESARKRHNNGDKGLSIDNMNKAIRIMMNIMNEGKYDFALFSYESALLLGPAYLDWWSNQYLGSENKTDLKIVNENSKYIK